jgi:hypothetical protein
MCNRSAVIYCKLSIDTVKKLNFSAHLRLLKFFEVVLPSKLHSLSCCKEVTIGPEKNVYTEGSGLSRIVYPKFKISWGHHIGLDETEPLTIKTRRIETAFWYVLYPALTWKGICVSRVALNPLPHSLLAVMLRISPTYNGSSVFSRSFGWLSNPGRHSDTKSKSPVQLIMSWHTRCLVLNG